MQAKTATAYFLVSVKRKQSVSDVEQIFSSGVLEFFESKGYSAEAEYVRIIRNWRRASDERGLSDEQRAQFNQDLLMYILNELSLILASTGKLLHASILCALIIVVLYIGI